MKKGSSGFDQSHAFLKCLTEFHLFGDEVQTVIGAPVAHERDLRARGLAGGVQDVHKVLVVVGGSGRIVNGEKIDAPALLRLKGHHQSEEIRVCFNMGRTQPRGNPADPDAFPARLENSNLLKWPGHLIRGSEDNLAAGDLILMSDPVKG